MRIIIDVTEDMNNAIDEYRWRGRHQSRSAAIRALIEQALELPSNRDGTRPVAMRPTVAKPPSDDPPW